MNIAELQKPLDPAHEAFDRLVSVDPNTGCWLWCGADNGVGYGKFRGKYSHRYSYERHKGSIPKGLYLDHLCRVPCCVNPDHLEPVTNRENALRGDTGKHMAGRFGNKANARKLDEASVRAIRDHLASGWTQAAVAGAFGVSKAAISHIATGRNWGQS